MRQVDSSPAPGGPAVLRRTSQGPPVPRHSASTPPWNVGVMAVLAGLVALGGIAILASAVFTAALILPVPPLQG